ncbi:Hypothetical predicted protein [Paramuricea clavata]|uniref:Uncharacterized protein n=1 Tax=Paramuricea clavata TaxID=317549 RepID=A0A6S7J4M8_PARCT|nr:Hypothetical predicted protein [Paramuricea clavata]
MSKSTLNASTEKAKTRSSEVYDTPNESEVKNGNQSHEIKRIDQIYDMVKSMMAKLDTLDEIKERILCVERDMGHMKDSIEFAHAELRELKEEADKSKRTNDLNAQKLCELEDSNRRLQESVIDLKARSMRNNLLFFNVNEDERENTTEKIYEILERNLEIPNARDTIKIDRSHRIGRKREGQRKPRAIVVKFNFHQDRERIRLRQKAQGNAYWNRGAVSRRN